MSKPRYRARGNEVELVSYDAADAARVRRHSGRMRGSSTQYAGASQVMREVVGWMTRNGDADTVLRELPTLRQRSADLVRNTPLFKGAMLTKAVNEIGTGLHVQSRLNHKLLGITEEQAADFEDENEHIWNCWASNPRECDLESTKSFTDILTQSRSAEFMYGEFAMQMVQSRRVGTDSRMRLSVIDTARLSNPAGRPDTQELAGGVLRSGRGAVLGYYFQNDHPHSSKLAKDPMNWTFVPRYSRRTRRQQVFHMFHQWEAGLSRGIPPLAPVLHKSKQGDRYFDAEIMAALVGGMVNLVFEQASESGLGVTDLLSDPDDKQLMDALEAIDGEVDNLALGYGSVMQAPAGTKANLLAPTRPNQQFGPFMKSLYEQISTAFGMPYEVFVQHFEKSYSAARSSFLMAWKVFFSERSRCVEQLCKPLYANLLEEKVRLGVIDRPGFLDSPAQRKLWTESAWIGPPAGSIDPPKEIAPLLDLLDAGLISAGDITQQILGQSYEEVVTRRAKEQRLRTKHGLSESEVLPRPTRSGESLKNDPDPDDDVDPEEDPDAEE